MPATEPLTGEVLVMSLVATALPPRQSTWVTLAFRGLDTSGTLVDEQVKLEIGVAPGDEDVVSWMRRVMGAMAGAL